MTAEQYEKRQRAWIFNYLGFHPDASIEEAIDAWQTYRISEGITISVADDENNTKTEMKNMQLNKRVVIPKVDMHELCLLFLKELQSGSLHDDLKTRFSSFELTNMMVSFSQASRALRFQCDQGTVTLCICDKPNGDDTIYYRPGDAPNDVGFGTPIWTISENGDRFIRDNEAIEKTDIGFLSSIPGKQVKFSIIISHLRNFRCENVPPSVIG